MAASVFAVSGVFLVVRSLVVSFLVLATDGSSVETELPNQIDGSIDATDRRILVDVGKLRVAQETSIRLNLKNLTSTDFEVIGVKTSCGCVAGKIGEPKVLRGDTLELDVTVRPASIVDVFAQQLSLQLVGGRARVVVLHGSVYGDVRINQNTLRYHRGGDLQVVRVQAAVPELKLQSFEMLSSVLKVHEVDHRPSGDVDLHVFSTLSTGQGIELLRVGYTLGESDQPKYAEFKIGVSAKQNHRFIPSTIQVSRADAIVQRKLFLVFSGAYAPEANELEGVFVAGADGEQRKLVESFGGIRVSCRKPRLWEVHVNLQDRESLRETSGIVLRFRGGDCLLPLVRE